MMRALAHVTPAPFHPLLGGIVLLLVLLFPLPHAHATPLELQPLMEGAITTSHLSVLEDPRRTLTIDEVASAEWQRKFTPLPGSQTSVGVSGSAWWVKLEVVNRGDAPIEWVASFTYPLTDFIDAYALSPLGVERHYATGDHRPFSSRPLASEAFAFPFHTAAHGSSVIYFRLAAEKQGIIDFYHELWTPAAYTEHQRHLALVLGIVLGGALMVALYNAFLLVVIRTAEYLWYLLYVVSALLLFITLSGLGYRYLWDGLSGLADALPVVASAVMFLFAVQFTRSFLDTPRYAPRWDRLLLALAGLSLCTLLLLAAGARGAALGATMVEGFALSLFPFIGAGLWRAGHRIARTYTIAWSIWTATTLAVIFKLLGLLPTNEITIWAARVGTLAEAIVLSLALADRINLLRREKLAAEAREMATLQRGRDELEERVRERTVELERAHREAEHMARTDALTGLANRRAFFERGVAALRCSVEEGYPISVVMIDIDRFKRINDTFGHAVGDEVIRGVSTVLARQCRESDIIARLGGEEFGLVLPHADHDAAERLAGRLREEIERCEFCAAGLTVRVTASIGLVERHDGSESLDQLMALADGALYEAKEGGRNRVVSPSRIRRSA